MRRAWGRGLFVAAVLIVGCTGGGSRPETPTVGPETGPTETVQTPTPSGTVVTDIDSVFGVPVVTLKPSPAVPLPPGLVLYTRDGLWEGAGGDLKRHYVSVSGQMQSETLFASTYGSEPRALSHVAGIAGDLWTEICYGACYGGVDPVSIRHSVDGGISWEEVMRNDSGSWVLGADSRGVVLAKRAPDRPVQLSRLSAAGSITSIPVSASLPLDVMPVARNVGDRLELAAVSDDQKTVWSVEDGHRIATIELPNPFQRVIVQGFVNRSAGRELALSWYGPGGPPDWDWYFGTLDISRGKFTRIVKGNTKGGTDRIYSLFWLNDHKAIARIGLDAARYNPESATWFGGIPAIIDFTTGEVSPIDAFVPQTGAKAGGPVPVALEIGRFAIVRTPGDCLNVRESPSVSATVVVCAHDGVILGVRPPDQDETEAQPWTVAATPDGREGWASLAYLEFLPFP